MPLNTADIESASRGDAQSMRRVFRTLSEALSGVADHVGYSINKAQTVREDQQIQPPQVGQIDVLGLNGHFYVTITPALPSVDRRSGDLPGANVLPGDRWGGLDGRRSRAIDLVRPFDGRRFGQVQHELQSATNLNFDAASNVTSYGPSTQIHYDILDPNQQKFWRFHSRFPNSEYNAWTFFINPSVCGPIAVDSGLLSTAGIVNLNTGNTPSVQPLTQHGVTSQIDVASTSNTFGSGANVSYNSGSVDPGSLGTWYVYLLDTQRKGGTVTYIATATVQDITNNDALVYLGKITTVGGGGGTGSGGGSGPCCIAEVEVDMLDGTVKAHKDLRRGDVLKAVDGGPEKILRIDLIANVPCFRFRTQGGLVLRGCSSSHLLQWDGGGFEPSSQIHESNRVDTKNGPQVVAQKDFIGHRTVYKLTLDRTKTYFADGFVSHNLILKP